MLHPDYVNPGSRLDLPELAGYLGVQDSMFEVVAIHPGGMGACIRLKSLSNMQTYALKCIRPDLLGDNDILNRFYGEVEVWLSASACNAVAEAIAVVRINDIPSVLAPWMDGGDLAHALPKFDPTQKFESIVRTLRALQWAKTALGIIHRDLKPANILLDKDWLSYVSDWGLARPLHNAIVRAGGMVGLSAIDRPDRTQLGSFVGTVTYAAPEQIMNAARVDHRADIYSLGCIMFELETGAPPFTGASLREIAYKHLHVTPSKLGGMFRRTTLGLERVIDRCLAKDPDARYTTYEELERDLLAVASRRNFKLNRCEVSERYKRQQLGKGHVVQQQAIVNVPIKGKDVVLIEFDDIAPYLEEAGNLIALDRYKEAEVLLRPYYVPNLIKSSTAWHYGHSCAETYANCLQHISGRLDEALGIYAHLNPVQEKPAEFYINYSCALLRSSQWADAKKVCQRGLARFPDDLDLLGNYTISLRGCGDIEQAQAVATRRLTMRRDVHSIEELAMILGAQRDRLRDRDLPQAISLAEIQYGLIREGLALNPRFPSLRITEIQFLRFAKAQDKALEACQTAMKNEWLPSSYRQLAFSEMVEELSESNHFKTALELIDGHMDEISVAATRERLLCSKWKIYADRYMIGKNNQSGERILIKEVADFFLRKKQDNYSYPVMAARVLEWLGRVAEAEDLLNRTIEGSKDSWAVRKELALLLQRASRYRDAISEANRLVEAAPWRAEVYDVLSYVADKAGDARLTSEAKKMGNQIFDREMELFDRLNALIS